MNSIVVSLIVFASVFGAALVGMALRRVLPEDHVGSDAKEVVRLSTGLIATMAALVLGLLVSSAKSAYDTSKNEVAEMSSDIVTIDRLLAQYGPETRDIRVQLRQLTESGLNRIWTSQGFGPVDLKPRSISEPAVEQLQLLAPKDDKQTAAKAQALSMILSLRRTQWLMFLGAEQNAVSVPLLVVLVLWLTTIFASFGLFAPPNSTVVVALALGALAVSSAIFIILEMYTPFRGVLRISPAPILDALSQMGR